MVFELICRMEVGILLLMQDDYSLVNGLLARSNREGPIYTGLRLIGGYITNSVRSNVHFRFPMDSIVQSSKIILVQTEGSNIRLQHSSLQVQPDRRVRQEGSPAMLSMSICQCPEIPASGLHIYCHPTRK